MNNCVAPQLASYISSLLLLFVCSACTLSEKDPSNSQRNLSEKANLLTTVEFKSVAKKVNQIAEKITVRIDAKEGNGSGVIIAHERDTYWVLTANHVVPEKGTYQVVTPDGKKHTVDYETVKSTEGIDLALLEFRSPKNYTVATLGDYYLGSIEKRPLVFLSGFASANPEKRNFSAGKSYPQVVSPFQVRKTSSLSMTSGYGLVYSNFSKRGMSGGPVLDKKGRVIGIHTNSEAQGEITEAGNKRTINLGQSLGVPIRTFVGVAPELGMEIEQLKVKTSAPPSLTDSKVRAITEGLFAAKVPIKERTAVDWLNYGNRLSRIEQYKKAVKAFERALQLQPNFSLAYYAKGKALELEALDLEFEEQDYQGAQKKFEQAAVAFKKAAKLNPSLYEAWRDHAEVLFNLEKFQQALTSINKAIDKNSKDFVLHYRRGTILENLGQLKKAEQAHNRAIALNPSAWTYVYRGMTRHKLQNYQGAIADFNQAIEFQPKLALPYSVRGATLAAMGKEKEALTSINKAIELQPNYGGHYVGRGLIYFASGNYKQAITDLSKVINHRNDFESVLQGTIYNAYTLRANARKKLENYKAAIRDFDKAIDLFPNRTFAYRGRAYLHSQQKNYQRAIADYTKIIELQPNDASAYSNRGDAYAQLGKQQNATADRKQALKLYTQTIESDPDNAQAYFGRAPIRLQLGNRQGAIQDLEKAAQLFHKKENQRGYQLAQQALSRLKSQ